MGGSPSTGHQPTFPACCASSRRQQNPAGLQLTHPHLLKENPMATDVQTRSLSSLTGARRGALLAYRWLLLAFLPLALYGGPYALDGLPVLGIAGLLYASTRRWRS
jgi:hypothetical protein